MLNYVKIVGIWISFDWSTKSRISIYINKSIFHINIIHKLSEYFWKIKRNLNFRLFRNNLSASSETIWLIIQRLLPNTRMVAKGLRRLLIATCFSVRTCQNILNIFFVVFRPLQNIAIICILGGDVKLNILQILNQYENEQHNYILRRQFEMRIIGVISDCYVRWGKYNFSSNNHPDLWLNRQQSHLKLFKKKKHQYLAHCHVIFFNS